MSADKLAQALELGLDAAKTVLVERKASFDGYPHKWRHEQEVCDTIAEAIAALAAHQTHAPCKVISDLRAYSEWAGRPEVLERALSALEAQHAQQPAVSGLTDETKSALWRIGANLQPAHVQGWQEVPMCSDNAVLHALDMARTESRKQGDQALFLAFGRAMWRQFNAMAAPQQGDKT